MPIFANILLCSSALVSGLVSTDRVRPVPNRTGVSRTPRSAFIPIHSGRHHATFRQSLHPRAVAVRGVSSKLASATPRSV
jgi:hypothetical protein